MTAFLAVYGPWLGAGILALALLVMFRHVLGRLLRLLLLHHGKIFSAQNLYESVWEEPYFAPSSNTVMVHIRKLREKVEEDPQNPELIKTVWGKGYRID